MKTNCSVPTSGRGKDLGNNRKESSSIQTVSHSLSYTFNLLPTRKTRRLGLTCGSASDRLGLGLVYPVSKVPCHSQKCLK